MADQSYMSVYDTQIMNLPFRSASSICAFTEQTKNTKHTTNKNQHYPKLSIGLAALAIIFVWSISNVSISHADSLLASIPVGSNPYGVAYDPANGNIYVANAGGNSVSVINEVTNSIVTTFLVGNFPAGVAYDSANGNIYVANLMSNTVSVINGATNTVITTIGVGASPAGVAYDSANGNIYVTNFGGNTVSVINGATNTVITTIGVGASPFGVAYDSANGNIYVTNFGGNTISVINGATNTLVSNIAVSNGPAGVAYDSANGNIYVTNYGGSTVSVINGATNTVITTIAVGANPIAAVFDSVNQEIYVANSASNSVTSINGTTNTIVTNTPVDINPTAITFDPTTHSIYVACYTSNTVDVILDSPPVILSSPIGTTGITSSADTTPPVITVPANIEVFPTGLTGAIVTYTVSATDPDDLSVTPMCTSASGSMFPIGTTIVTCFAQDAAGNKATPMAFTVKVYTPAEGAKKIEDQVSTLNTALPGTITSLDMLLHTKMSLLPGFNGYPLINLNAFITEVNQKCCLQIDADTGHKFITEAQDVVAATP